MNTANIADSEPQPLEFSPEEVAHFVREGYIVAKGLVSPTAWRKMREVTLDHIRRHVLPVEYEADLSYPGAPASRTAAGGRTIRRLKQALSRDAVFTDWIASAALGNRLRQLLGPQIVSPLAHHNCVMTKNPDYSSDTGWHQDIRYWSYARPDLVSVWLALGPENVNNGCLRLIPGSHDREFDRRSFDEQLFFRADLPENRELVARSIPAELEAGDVLFFHCRTLHAASRNHAREPKLSVVFTFRPVDNLPVPGSRSASMPELLLPAPAV